MASNTGQPRPAGTGSCARQGRLTRPIQLAVLMLAVVLLVLQGLAINRAAGIDYPLWAPRPDERPRRSGAG